MTTPPLCTLTDEELVALFRAGEERAFGEIHDRYRIALVAFARRLLRRSGHDPEDVVQNAFLRAYPSLRATDRAMALRAWLYMIVRNAALDELRRPQRSEDLDEGLRLVAAPGGDPAQQVAMADDLRRVVDDIRRLPERQRMALVMRELDGRSHRETARALGTTVPATKSLLVRARAGLDEAQLVA